MSDIDEIALNVVKAISNIDPDKLPGGRTQALAQAQILVRDAINGEVEALKAANRDLQDWFDDARATAEQAQARVAELEHSVTELIQHYSETWDGPILRRAEASRDGSGHSFMLRKQAEAVEYCWTMADEASSLEWLINSLADHQLYLIKQANELEAGKAGGGQCL